ncbi:MAG TPA: phosphoribosylanthranilate isomerase [Pirellulales bacterium]|nr:phosphoribosylanthranilate isomerase [Pirellulales bacterium]
MFRTKICGITRVEDARAAAEAGADCIGLNFYPGSARHVGREQAREIREAVRGRMLVAGVFVDAPATTIAEIARGLELELVQLSGNESPQDVAILAAALGDIPIMQAVRAGGAGLTTVRAHLDECRRLVCLPRLVLWDAFDTKQFGGTGRVADWSAAAAYVAAQGLPPLVLAGGLKSENVADAILAVRPRGVDTASGVECSPGVKDAAKMRSFVEAARAAFDKAGRAD